MELITSNRLYYTVRVSTPSGFVLLHVVYKCTYKQCCTKLLFNKLLLVKSGAVQLKNCFDDQYFVIHAIFCNSIITLLCTAKEAYLKKLPEPLLIHKSIVLPVYSLPLVFSYTYFSDKYSKLVLIFIHAWTGQTPLQLEGVRYTQ